MLVGASSGRDARDALDARQPRAAATAALSAAWTPTLSARSVRDAGHRRARRAAAGPPARPVVVDRRRVEAVGRGEGDEVGAVRRAEQLLEALGGQRRRLREEREDAAAVVVDDDDRAGRRRGRRSAVSALASWRKAMSPTSDDRRSRRRRATPSAVDTTPSMPLAPRLAWARAAGPPNHSRSRTGIDEATTSCGAVGQVPATVRATPARSAAPRRPRTSSIAASAPCAGRQPAVAPRRRRRRRAARRRAPAARPASRRGGDAVVGVDRRRARRPARRGAPRRGDPLGEHLRRRRPAEAHDDVGRCVGGEALVRAASRRTAATAPAR